MSRENRQAVNALKNTVGWIDNYTPPLGYSLNSQVRTIQSSAINATMTNNNLPDLISRPPPAQIRVPQSDYISHISTSSSLAGSACR